MSFEIQEPVMILAGGLGTRLARLNLGVPKALIPFDGKPFLEWKLESLRLQGFSRFILSVGNGSDEILNFLDGAGVFDGVEIAFDIAPNCGTGVALRNAFPSDCNAIFVTYGDNLTFCNPEKILEVSEIYSSSVLSVEDSNRVDLTNGNATFVRQPFVHYSSEPKGPMPFVDHGMLLVRREDLENASVKLEPERASRLATVLEEISIQKKLVGVESYATYLEFGNEASYHFAQSHFRDYYQRYVH